MAFSLALLSAGRSGLRLGACALALGLAFNAHAAKKDDTLRMAYDQAPESVDPYYNNVRIGVIIAANVWDTLLYRDPMTNEYKGQLAKSWKQVDDKTLEFELRQGVKFHNGEEFDADSVVYTLNFVADPKNKAVTQQNVAWIDKVEKIDKYHVRLTTKEPFPGAKEYLSTTVAIHPAKYYQEVGPKGMNAKPVGSGPYKVADYQPGKSITLERNTDYFKDSPKAQPKIGKVVIRFIPDRQTQMAEVISGGEDLIMSVPKDQADQLRTVPTLQVVNGETMRIVFMQMNILENSPAPQLKDERVRRAIIHAIDRQAILKNIVGEGGAILNAICTPSQVGCTQDVPTYKYDPAQAKKLLAEAGYPNGFDIDILAYRERNQTEAIINYLQAVGIRAKLNFLQYAAMRDMIRAGKASITHQTWASNLVNDVSASTPVYFGFGNDDITRDAKVKALLDKGDHTIEAAPRAAAYKEALSMIAEKAYAVPLWTLPVYYVANKDLAFKPYPDELTRFWDMSWK
ncbi:ABC transporter substrate-binding protein [Bordetella pseudohinzii]|uniref:ABC transporter substrate-binding protein n=1 Tax=Bordetella pseudohinzii TaxID=1331258 RepID=A0A0J6C8L0_9BORD|nr:ABC transporter substrate-binding protein [Bordetella pseudohinzii]ANY17480.1 ABC transporter substrate-binding protein [Bordetella pseudohinzii]KMM25707.1 ABC transporter substrate-binding protein [Bordetella pseudohinzii]KXA81697.1 ABC transporter substrate-binding protein [Bordetella pseudohinzii]KXA83064.1 ABC transporter substrate-binding protein [Bordetella pseudohinzii]CUI72136.1 Glutathione-binding protein gsiB precursor [Bordetella pseudohinzii]